MKMQMSDNLLVIKYREILKYNGISPERIKFLVKEYIDYIEGKTSGDISDELSQFLEFIKQSEEQNKQELNGKRI